MNTFLNKFQYNLNIFYLIFIFFFSFLVNFYYSKIGVYPVDTFLHYDPGYKILRQEYPVKDFWVASGFVVDFFQSIFFKIFGVNWSAYVFHSSLFNSIISLTTYYFFISLKIRRFECLIYTLCFSILAYTISGTPFVDQHSTFFLLLATFSIHFAFQNASKRYLWILAVVFFFLSFLSKQVPTAYALILQGLLILVYVIKEKKKDIFILILSASVSIIFFFLLILLILKISFIDFYYQYILFPTTIGSDRYEFFNKSPEIFFNQYKYIFLPISLLFIIKLKEKTNKENSINKTQIYQYLLLLSFTLCLVLHQLMTKNQIFIYFLIPIIFALLSKEIIHNNVKYSKVLNIFVLICVVLLTLKYHLRFNETRKFHELSSTNLNNFISAESLDQSLKGLKWINSLHKEEPSLEISFIKEGAKELINIDQKINVMLITNYSFLESVTEKNLHMPSRAFTFDGTTIPLLGSRMYERYKTFFTNILAINNIERIYLFNHEKIPEKVIEDYLPAKCFEKKNETIFKIYFIKC